MRIPSPKKLIDVEEATRMHLEEGLSLAEIARQLGYRATSIGRAIRASGARVRQRRPRVSTDADRRLYTTWRSIVGRCTRPADPLFKRYGARGIGLCEAWRDFAAFRAWAVANGWKSGLCLGLDMRSRGYAPGNCTWITRSQNIEEGILAGPRGARFGITAFGETKSASAWAEDPRCTVGGQGLLERINRGVPPERAITMPRVVGRKRGSRTPQDGRTGIDWKKARELHVKKGLGVADTALVLDASYHGVLRGLRARGWLRTSGGTSAAKLRHGRLLHKVWQNMRERCWSQAHPEYERIGRQGIRVCDSWDDFGAFYAWALRSGYRPRLCLARLDRRADYEPSNCRWLTRQEILKRTVRPISRKPRWTVSAFGEGKGPFAWSRDRRCAVSFSGLVNRLRNGWKPEDAIVTPPATPGRDEPSVWVTAFGQTKGVEDWVRDRRCRVGRSSLRQRLRKGVPAEVAITTPPIGPHARRPDRRS